MRIETYLATFIRFAYIIDVTFTVIVLPTRNDCIHTTRFSFETGGNSRVSSTALYLKGDALVA